MSPPLNVPHFHGSVGNTLTRQRFEPQVFTITSRAIVTNASLVRDVQDHRSFALSKTLRLITEYAADISNCTF